jgi:nitric oxide reductase subunit B
MIRKIKKYPEALFLILASLLLGMALLSGVMAGLIYLFPNLFQHLGGFKMLRPWHVSSAVFWILTSASGLMMLALREIHPTRTVPGLIALQILLLLIGIFGVFYSYSIGDFGGREYWEFNPIWALPIGLAWCIHLLHFFTIVSVNQSWPVYYWMWMTGSVFFLFTFLENYLWMIPEIRQDLIRDMTIQWKVNGSLVGSWNQLIYGTAFYLMEKTSGNKELAKSRLSFLLYFLGLFNLMFNWGHHIYTLPTESYVRLIAYAVSMTEWIFLARIFYFWKQNIRSAKAQFPYFPYRFLMAADFWIFLSMAHAILISIPALNLFTHGTHVTVAHAMGTTIGINSMIILSGIYQLLPEANASTQIYPSYLRHSFWIAQGSLLVFWISLNGAGITKGIWMHSHSQISFSQLMTQSMPWFGAFVVSGTLLLLSLSTLVYFPILNYFKNSVKS